MFNTSLKPLWLGLGVGLFLLLLPAFIIKATLLFLLFGGLFLWFRFKFFINRFHRESYHEEGHHPFKVGLYANFGGNMHSFYKNKHQSFWKKPASGYSNNKTNIEIH
ncbi:MAG: hypothetical protein AAGI07_08495 [Bacteroidota bacterium]